jgi:transcription antitermination factor NusA-like protein
MVYMFDDDGTGGDWEEALTKKQQKHKENKMRKDEEAKQVVGGSGQAVVGKLPPGASFVQKAPKGGAKGKAKAGEPAVSQLVTAVPAVKVAVAAGGAEAPETKGAENSHTESIPVPPEKIGRIIGPKGATLKMIFEKTGLDRIDTQRDVWTIIGEAGAVAKAAVAIRELIEKGFMSLAFDNFNEQTVMVHPSNFPDIIGSKGAIIRKMKEELKVEVNIPQSVTKDSKGSYGKKKYPITLAGSAQSVEQAKKFINEIVHYKHHKITHEDMVHEELELEECLTLIPLSSRSHPALISLSLSISYHPHLALILTLVSLFTLFTCFGYTVYMI